MVFEQLKEKINNLNCDSKDELKDIILNIDIKSENMDSWINSLFGDKIKDINFEKLPYLIDELYQSDDKMLFILCCMLIEATCEYLPFITNLEYYPLFKAKFEALKHTLVTVYDMVDNGIANCMALIILNNDPEFKMFTDEEKNKITTSTKRKLDDIINYLKNNKEINSSVYIDLEVIIDLSVYLNDKEIETKIIELNSLPLNFECKLFLAKYKIINNLTIDSFEIDELLKDKNKLNRVISLFERFDALNKIPADRVTQEDIAKSSMLDWLIYPTELGKEPDDIELIDKLEYQGLVYYIYKFRSSDFRIKEYMLGVSGGYEKDKITARNSGHTFSEFNEVSRDFKNQAIELIELINKHWKERG